MFFFFSFCLKLAICIAGVDFPQELIDAQRKLHIVDLRQSHNITLCRWLSCNPNGWGLKSWLVDVAISPD